MAGLNVAQIRQIITYLDDADSDLRALQRAGVDVGYPLSLISKAMDYLNDALPEEN